MRLVTVALASVWAAALRPHEASSVLSLVDRVLKQRQQETVAAKKLIDKKKARCQLVVSNNRAADRALTEAEETWKKEMDAATAEQTSVTKKLARVTGDKAKVERQLQDLSRELQAKRKASVSAEQQAKQALLELQKAPANPDATAAVGHELAESKKQFERDASAIAALRQTQEKELAALADKEEALTARSSSLKISILGLKRKLANVDVRKERMTAFRRGLEEECQTQVANFNAQEKLRQGQVTQFKMARALLEPAAAATFLQVTKASDQMAQALTQPDAFLSALGDDGESLTDAVVAAPLARSGESETDDEPTAMTAPEPENPKRGVAKTSLLQGDPLKDVKGMIRGLMTDLRAEMNADVGKAQFCDEQFAKGGRIRREKSRRSKEIQATIAVMKDDRQALDREASFATEMRAGVSAQLARLASDQVQFDKDMADRESALVGALRDAKTGASELGQALALVQGNANEALGMLESGIELMTRQQALMRKQVSEMEGLRKTLGVTAREAEDAMEKSAAAAETAAAQNEEDQAELFDEGTRLSKELEENEVFVEGLKQKCFGPSREDRMRQREDTIKDLQSALAVLKGEELP